MTREFLLRPASKFEPNAVGITFENSGSQVRVLLVV